MRAQLVTAAGVMILGHCSVFLVAIASLIQVVLLAKEKIYYVDFEHLNVTYWNPKYLSNVNASCRRHSRRDPVHYCYVHGETLAAAGNNVLLDYYVYEFLSNEYRPSFVELHVKLCDLLLRIPNFGQLVKHSKGLPTTCPIPKMMYHLENFSIVDLPMLRTFPFQKGRVFLNVTGKITPDSPLEIIGNGHVDGSIKQMWR